MSTPQALCHYFAVSLKLTISPETVTLVIDVALVLLTSKTRRQKYPGYACAVEKTHVTW